jgi:hypothetical protein
MVGEQDDGLKLKNSNPEDNNEIEATKIEIRDNYAVIIDEPKNEDAFFVVLYNKPLHKCMETFNDGWSNIWHKGNMLLGDYGISEQQDQVLKSLLTCCLEMLVLLSPIFI